jgi:chorismate mutase
MLTRPNVSEPFQIAAIRKSPGWSELPIVCMEANQMPPVETNFVMPLDAKKAPYKRGFF